MNKNIHKQVVEQGKSDGHIESLVGGKRDQSRKCIWKILFSAEILFVHDSEAPVRASALCLQVTSHQFHHEQYQQKRI